jgi:hypothetical protein
MNSRVLDRMQARARAVVTRAAVRSWSYRQRNLAAGVWFRLRRVLADAKAAYVISEEQARELMAEGHVPLTCGDEVAPRKIILFVDERRISTVGARRQIPVNLGPDFLAASAVALVPFEASTEDVH